MSDDDRTVIHAAIWLAVGTLLALRDVANSKAAVDQIVAGLRDASERVMKPVQ